MPLSAEYKSPLSVLPTLTTKCQKVDYVFGAKDNQLLFLQVAVRQGPGCKGHREGTYTGSQNIEAVLKKLKGVEYCIARMIYGCLM